MSKTSATPPTDPVQCWLQEWGRNNERAARWGSFSMSSEERREAVDQAKTLLLNDAPAAHADQIKSDMRAWPEDFAHALWEKTWLLPSWGGPAPVSTSFVSHLAHELMPERWSHRTDPSQWDDITSSPSCQTVMEILTTEGHAAMIVPLWKATAHLSWAQRDDHLLFTWKMIVDWLKDEPENWGVLTDVDNHRPQGQFDDYARHRDQRIFYAITGGCEDWAEQALRASAPAQGDPAWWRWGQAAITKKNADLVLMCLDNAENIPSAATKMLAAAKHKHVAQAVWTRVPEQVPATALLLGIPHMDNGIFIDLLARVPHKDDLTDVLTTALVKWAIALRCEDDETLMRPKLEALSARATSADWVSVLPAAFGMAWTDDFINMCNWVLPRLNEQDLEAIQVKNPVVTTHPVWKAHRDLLGLRAATNGGRSGPSSSKKM